MRRAALVAGMTLASVLAAEAPVSAIVPNLILNGDFDTAVTGWTNLSPAFSTRELGAGEDSDLCVGSGGLVVINSNAADNGSQAVIQSDCRTGVVGGDDYRLEGDIHFPELQDPGEAQAIVLFYDNETCAGEASVEESFLPVASSAPGWLRSDVRDIEASLLAQSVRVRLVLVKAFSADDPITVHFDRVRVLPESFVWGDDFEVGSICRWDLEDPS
jgi:hypothetical protein